MKLVAGLATARGLRPQHDLGILFEASVAYKDIEIAPFLEKVSDKKGELATLAYTYCGTYAQGRRPTPESTDARISKQREQRATRRTQSLEREDNADAFLHLLELDLAWKKASRLASQLWKKWPRLKRKEPKAEKAEEEKKVEEEEVRVAKAAAMVRRR